jgi:uncharacterized RDD family membrane protein YckC
VSTTNPYAPPLGAVRDIAPADELELAGRGARLAAAFLDGIVAFVMIYLPALALLVATDLDDSAELDAATFATLGLLCLIGFIAWAWITALLVARNGQTIAKRLLEIKVVRSDGTPASLGRIFWLRNFVNWLLGVIPLYVLVDALFIFSERRQCLHDLIADTIVVRA